MGDFLSKFGLLIVGTISAIFFGWQLWIMSKARKLESTLAVLQYLDNLDLRTAYWFVCHHVKDIEQLCNEAIDWNRRQPMNEKINQLSGGTVELKNIEILINALNNIAYLIRQGHAHKDLMSGLLKNMFLRSWYSLEPYIKRRRENRPLPDEPSTYANDFEKLVKHIENKLRRKRSRTKFRQNLQTIPSKILIKIAKW